MKTADIRKKTKDELKKNLQDLQEDLSNLHFEIVANKLKNVREIRNKKKDIARIITIMNSKQ